MNGGFTEHCSRVARRFVQTAIVIDNEAHFGPPPADVPSAPAIRASGSVLEEEGDDQHESDPRASEGVADLQSHILDAKSLSDAFLHQSVICGLYKPRDEEDASVKIKLSTNAAIHADVVVIDWYLERSSSRTAKEIIRGILLSDLDDNGRLRLIAVYTSQPGLTSLADEVLEFIETDARLRGRLARDPAGSTLIRGDTRICFFNKPDCPDSADVEIVPESDLPNRLIEQFAILNQGLLATFALQSISEIRRSAHHILTLFGPELDGAYVAHRCSLPDPDDAREFANDLISEELRNVITMAGVSSASLGTDKLDAWVDSISSGDVLQDHHSAALPVEVVKEFVRGGAASVEGSQNKQHIIGQPGKPPSKSQKLKLCNIGNLFYASPSLARLYNRRLARLSSFRREAGNRTRFPEGWLPTLTLGTVLKEVPSRARVDAGYVAMAFLSPETAGDHAELIVLDAARSSEKPAERYLLCMQPRCDSVRLLGVTSFPFQSAGAGAKGFNLVVGGDGGEDEEISVKLKPKDAVMIEFAPQLPSGRVLATSSEGAFYFVDVVGRKYKWIGDLKSFKAQNSASELAARVHSVGFNELEWLRLAAKGGVE